MNAIIQQWGVQHIIVSPLHKARCIVMRECPVQRYIAEDDDDDDDGNDQSQSRPTSKYPCHHVVMNAWTVDRSATAFVADNQYDDYWDGSDSSDDEYCYHEEEEEEATTSSCSSDSSSSDDEPMPLLTPNDGLGIVTFATPLVTAIHERPVTTELEKNELFYTDLDYREFRRDFITYSKLQHRATHRFSQQQQHQQHDDNTSNIHIHMTTKPTVVQFHTDLISDVHTIPTKQNPSELYYSRTELQGFLDDFVASLSKGV